MNESETVAKLPALKAEFAPLRQKIIAALRRAIEMGVLKPGERLIEKDLCAQLNVSRTCLREALRELEAQRVIANSATRGLMVTPITTEDAANIYRVRAELEALIAEQFIERADGDDLAVFAAAADGLKRAYVSQSLEKILDAKKAYYDAFCAGARNPVVFDLLMALHLRTSQLRAASLSRDERKSQSIDEIDRVTGAIARGDTAAARAAARQHVEHAARSSFIATGRDPNDAVTASSRRVAGRLA
jgi:DNA-binding GntR family transcriptional regulator